MDEVDVNIEDEANQINLDYEETPDIYDLDYTDPNDGQAVLQLRGELGDLDTDLKLLYEISKL